MGTTGSQPEWLPHLVCCEDSGARDLLFNLGTSRLGLERVGHEGLRREGPQLTVRPGSHAACGLQLWLHLLVPALSLHALFLDARTQSSRTPFLPTC